MVEVFTVSIFCFTIRFLCDFIMKNYLKFISCKLDLEVSYFKSKTNIFHINQYIFSFVYLNPQMWLFYNYFFITCTQRGVTIQKNYFIKKNFSGPAFLSGRRVDPWFFICAPVRRQCLMCGTPRHRASYSRGTRSPRTGPPPTTWIELQVRDDTHKNVFSRIRPLRVGYVTL